MRSLLGVFAGVLLTLTSASADDRQAIPPVARITDTTGTLTADQKQSLDAKLSALEQSKGSQIAILVIPTTHPEEIEEYSYRVADNWKLGRKGVDDGVLFTVAKNDHKVRIDVGRGFEGAIPDVTGARIIREYVTPKFRAGDFYGGINDAVDALTKLIDGEPLPAPLEGKRQVQPRGLSGDLFNALIFSFFAALWMRGLAGRLPAVARGGVVAAASGGLAWLISGIFGAAIGMGVFGLIVGLIGGGGGGFANRGGWGGWNSGFGGGSWGSGGGGGGFSGGGGGFSGGGASGSW
jgi:uncharacterized protein